jgi:Polysaccharide pyruvyl transferase
MNRNPVLGQLGTFDVENYGDLLYPVLFKKMLEQRRKNGEVTKFSVRGSDCLQDSGYRSRPVSRLFSSRSEQPHSLVVGGGDLLHTEWDTVVSYYRSLCEEEGEKLVPNWWRRKMMKFQKKSWTADTEFRRRYLDYSSIGPFMIRPDERNIKSVAYCSCGVPSPFNETIRQEITDTFNDAQFIYVRDHRSKDNLTSAGVTNEIHVAPDLVVALSDFFDATSERQKGRDILRQRGVDVDRRILIFQCNRQSPEHIDVIVAQLKSFQSRDGCEVVLVPLGGCHGDREYLKEITDRSGGTFHYVPLRSIFDIISVLASCDIFLGTSMHGNITAFSFGIPHGFGPINLKKREGFLDVVCLPEDLKTDSWNDLYLLLDRLGDLDRDFFKTRADAAKLRVHAVFDKLCDALNSQGSPAS